MLLANIGDANLFYSIFNQLRRDLFFYLSKGKAIFAPIILNLIDMEKIEMKEAKGRLGVLVVGVGGLGEPIAQALLQNGADLVLADRKITQSPLQDEARALGRKCLLLHVDLQEEDSIIEMVRQAEEQTGGIDILVNAAGVNQLKKAEEYDAKTWDFVMGVNLRGLHFVTREVGKGMIARRYGRILSISYLSTMNPELSFLSDRNALKSSSIFGIYFFTELRKVLGAATFRYGDPRCMSSLSDACISERMLCTASKMADLYSEVCHCAALICPYRSSIPALSRLSLCVKNAKWATMASPFHAFDIPSRVGYMHERNSSSSPGTVPEIFCISLPNHSTAFIENRVIPISFLPT